MMRAILLALLAYPLAAQSGLYINLADGWRTTDQDDPAMARPDYDDSAWNKADFSKISAPRSILGANGWLRRTVDLPDWADRRHLALTLGHLPANYEVFVNGQRCSGMAISIGKFDIDPVYEPALEVGGDFHWTRVEPDGSLIAVAGDVSGKGLKAAMLVSVAIGILRNEKSSSPATILGALNEGLVGHTGGGFITCCCARFCVDGNTTIANAGHLSPYCDGREVTS